ncbi:hypothetical protein, conserved [Babesia bigemina]|uniref:Uncharacterized protein n=1 Tax=Babesia bigemina TaxID=5866 RepID=A0A061DAR0_BABBI|nr:hypothetical protein, conserved [Babesia bigemina]CDR97077.1 hypothetical protein, conserved [Babesia bigemina]|eukprot:XP_012769263.1 hypothetical protein, conserved [Babesia bigemina]
MAIDPARHSMMLNKYQIASLVSFVCVVIPLSLIAYGLKFVVNKSELFILATVMGSAFAVLSAVSLYYYCSGLGYAAPADYTVHYGSVELSVASAWDEMCCKLDDIKEGMLLACSSGSLMRQIFFVSMETAFEHSLICFCVPLTALDRTLFPDRGILHAAIICSLLVSAGKFGGSVYGLYAAMCPPRNSRDVVPIRMTKVYSCLSLVALSICSYANDGDPYSTMVQMMVVGALIFTFFAFSAYPKAVVSSIMNVAILSHPLSYKIFDFVNTFAVICDIVLTIALTVFMNKAVGTVGINGTVVSVTVFYIFHTLYHVLIGIRLSDVSPESRMHSPHVPYGPPLGRL